jgi:acetyl esterase/lipase
MENQIVVERYVVFGKTERELLTADLFQPSNSKDELPILVLIHGGAYQTGSKEMYKEWGEALAGEGYFVMAINYRLATPSYFIYPSVLQDIEMAMNWLVSNANAKRIDVGRIGLIGDSAGAHLAALFALKYQPFSYKICSVVGVYGIYDFIEECKNPVSSRTQNMFEQFLGLPLTGNEDVFIEASPSHYIEKAADNATFDTSFYLVSGGRDKIVNPNQSRLFYEKLKEAGIEAQITEIDDIGHFWFNLLPGIEGGGLHDYPNNVVYPKIISFLHKHVQKSTSVCFSKKRLRLLAGIENLPINI